MERKSCPREGCNNQVLLMALTALLLVADEILNSKWKDSKSTVKDRCIEPNNLFVFISKRNLSLPHGLLSGSNTQDSWINTSHPPTYISMIRWTERGRVHGSKGKDKEVEVQLPNLLNFFQEEYIHTYDQTSILFSQILQVFLIHHSFMLWWDEVKWKWSRELQMNFFIFKIIPPRPPLSSHIIYPLLLWLSTGSCSYYHFPPVYLLKDSPWNSTKMHEHFSSPSFLLLEVLLPSPP